VSVRVDRFVGEFVPASTPRGPAVARDLLVLLGVTGAAKGWQRRAVRQWLAEHDADAVLRASLDRAGLL